MIYWLAILLVCLMPRLASATATVSSSASLTDVQRAGINLQGDSYYLAQMASNILPDPGFEQPSYNQIFDVTAATTSQITSDQDTGDAANAWAGATCVLRVGTCSDSSNNYCWNPTSGATATQGGCTGGPSDCNAGGTFTVSASSTSSGHDVLTCSGTCPTLAAEGSNPYTGGGYSNVADVVSCVQTQAITSANWNATIGNGGWHANNSAPVSLETGTVKDGLSALEFNSATSTETLSLEWDVNNSGLTPSTCVSHPADMCYASGDCPSGDTCSGAPPAVQHPVYGNWTWSFWAYTTASSGAACSGTFGRSGGPANFTNHSISLTTQNTWTRYTYNFTGQDTSATAPALLTFSFVCTGGVVYVDDMYLGSASPATAYAPSVVAELKAMNVGSIRESDEYPMTQTSAGITESQMQGSRYTVPPTGQAIGNGPSSGSNTAAFADLAGVSHAVGNTTSPHYTIPIGWTDSEYTSFGAWLCSNESTYSFPAQYTECGNENWNGPGNNEWKLLLDSAYGSACARDLFLIQAACADSQLHFFLDNQTGNSGVLINVLTGVSGVMPNTAQWGATENLYSASATSITGDTIAQVIENTLSNITSIVATFANASSGDAAAVCSNATLTGQLSPCFRNFSNYEWSVQNFDSSAALLSSQSDAGWGSATVGVYTLLEALVAPVAANPILATNLFTLNQGGGGFSGTTYAMWGATGQWAGTSDLNPPVWPWLNGQGLAVELFNSAVEVDNANGDYHAISGLPSGVAGAAFYNSSANEYQAILVNTNNSSQSVSLAFPSSTTVPTVAQSINYTSGMTDNNEDSNSVTIGALSGGVSYSGQTASFTIPALAVAALEQPAAGTGGGSPGVGWW